MTANQMKSPLMLHAAMIAGATFLVLSGLIYWQAGVLIEDLNDAASLVTPSVVKDNYRVLPDGEPEFVDLEGRQIEQAIPLPLPAKTVNDIVAWTTMVGVQVFTLDFFQAEKQLQKSRPYFTKEGWDAMMTALNESGWLSSVKEKKLSVTSVLKEPASVLKHGVLDDAYTWVIHFPLLVSYESPSESRVETRTFTLRVKRIKADFSSGQAGIAIDSFVSAAEAGGL